MPITRSGVPGHTELKVPFLHHRSGKTRGPFGPRFFCAAILAAAAVSGKSQAWAGSPGIEVEIDLRNARSGEITVVVSGRHPRRGAAGFLVTGAPAIQIKDPELETAAGRKVPLERTGHRLRAAQLPAGEYRLHYTVRPGGPGRHGNQGNADERFAVFDGRVLVLPEDQRQLWPVRFRFELPAGWRSVSPYPLDAGRYVAGATALTKSRELLEKTCQAFGPFEAQTKRFGSTEAAVYVYADWNPDHKRQLMEKSLNLYRAFYDRYAFDPGGMQQIVWTPRSLERKRVFGGASAISNCLEMPEESTRGFELLAHRIAHALNKYEPIGVKTAPGDDRWFNEGWATYEEIAATRAAGLVEDDRRWNGWYRSYLYTAQRRPTSARWPLSRDHAASPALAEFLHYRKSPLVMAMLEYQIRQADGKSLAEFVRSIYPRYRNGRKRFSFRSELEKYAGRDFDRFWKIMVRGPGPEIPVWPEYFTNDNLKRAPALSAGKVGLAELHPDFLFELAVSGRFKRYGDIVSFLGESAARLDLPEKIWRPHFPPELHRNRLTVPGLAAVLLRDYENAMIPELRRHAGRSMPVTWNRDDATGAMFHTLIDAERDYERQVRSSPEAAVWLRSAARSGGSERQPVLALRSNGRFDVEIATAKRNRSWTLELVAHDNRVLATRELPASANSAEFEISEPGFENSGVYRVRVRDGNLILSERAFWVRLPGQRPLN